MCNRILLFIIEHRQKGACETERQPNHGQRRTLWLSVFSCEAGVQANSWALAWETDGFTGPLFQA